MPIQFDKEVEAEEEESDIVIDSPTYDEVSEVCEDELNRMVKVCIRYCITFSSCVLCAETKRDYY